MLFRLVVVVVEFKDEDDNGSLLKLLEIDVVVDLDEKMKWR